MMTGNDGDGAEQHNEPLLGAGSEDGNLFDGLDVQVEEPPPPPPPLSQPPRMPPPPTYLQATAQPDCPPPAPPAYGQPAYGQPQNFNHNQVQTAHGIMHLPDLPDTIEEWKAARPLLQSWLYLSIATIVTSLFMFWPGLLVGILSTVAASMHLCKCCGGGGSLAGPIAATHTLSMVVLGVDALILALIGLQTFALVVTGCNLPKDEEEDGFLEDDVEEDSDVSESTKCVLIVCILLLTLTWYSVHALITYRVMDKAAGLKKWLNPVTSGVVVL